MTKHNHEPNQECSVCNSKGSAADKKREIMSTLSQHIAKTGMAIIGIIGTRAYTVGRAASGKPELYMSAPMTGVAQRIFNDIDLSGVELFNGVCVPAGTIEGLGYDLHVFDVTVHMKTEEVHFALMPDFNQGKPVAFFQVIFADANNKMPWAPDYDKAFDQEPILSVDTMKTLADKARIETERRNAVKGSH